jgi:hypothetical protein
LRSLARRGELLLASLAKNVDIESRDRCAEAATAPLIHAAIIIIKIQELIESML